jgi:undecaprenyl diphosphate synthase
MKIFNKKKTLDLKKIPRHVAFIMDGNGRWAKKRGLPRIKGHQEGAKRTESLAVSAKELGIEVVTLFVFSTENWKRPKEEIDCIFSLLKKFLTEGKETFVNNDVRIHFIGKIDELGEELSSLMYDAMESTKNNKGIILNLAINYGSRSEIVEMVKSISRECVEGKQEIDKITEDVVENHLMTKDLPPIDLMVRTSGEIRMSNFLLWQIAYSELFFTDVCWPDFDGKELEKVLIEFQSRDRRYGGLN